MPAEEVFDVRRAEESTAALLRWCDSQSQMATFSGICLCAQGRDAATARRLAGRG